MGRARGCIWLVAGLLIAALAGVLAYLYLTQAENRAADVVVDQSPRVDVVVAARAVLVLSPLTEADLTVAQYPVETVPGGALATVEEAVGRVTLVDLYPGEPLLAQRLIDPNYVSGDGRHAVALNPEEVLLAFPAGNLMTTLTVLKPGDRVDIHITLNIPVDLNTGVAAGEAAEQEEEPTTFIVLQNVGIAGLPGAMTTEQTDEGGVGGVINGQPQQTTTQPPTAVLFTLSPQDALVLKYVMDAGAIDDIVLRAPGATTPFEVDAVNMDYVINRYSIPTEVEP